MIFLILVIQIDYIDLSQNEKISILNELANSLISSIETRFPYESSLLLGDFHNLNIIPKIIYKNYERDESDEIFRNNPEIISSYENAGFRVKRQILSLIVNKYTKVALMNAFGIGRKLVDSARKHALYGAGMPVCTDPIFREKLDWHKIEIFIEFICSDNYLQDVAHGNLNLKINNKYSLSIPKAVRLASHSRIISEYIKICKSNDLEPISESYCYKILKECSASHSKNLQGLDNMYADGLDAFDKLINILNTLKDLSFENLDLENLEVILQSSKNYLKFSIKNHLKFSSDCADHCVMFALSKEKLCEHEHQRKCQDCNMIDFSIDSLKKHIQSLVTNEIQKSEIFYEFEKEKIKIIEWKNHQIRSWCQDQIKYKILNELDNNSIYLHCDWAMKFLPMKYREKQEDWYAKKGIPWHASVAVFLKDNSPATSTFFHAFASTSQDVDAVIGIVDSVFDQIYSQMGSKCIYFRSDNAGCYHNKTLVIILNFLAKKYKHTLKRYDFCEPQTGKDICDRKIAQAKLAINSFIQKGNNVESALDIKKAILSSNSIDGFHIQVCEVNDLISFKNDFEFKNITSYHSFEYFDNHLLAFNNYNVGFGKKIKYVDQLREIDVKNLVIKLKKASLKIIEYETNNNDTALINLFSNNLFIFKCEICEFITSEKNELKEHAGSHEVNLSQLAKTKIMYAKKLRDIRTQNLKTETEYKKVNETLFLNSVNALKNGYGLKVMSKNRFTQNVKDYLTEHFNVGEKTGRKIDPKAVEKEMVAKTDKFIHSERLSAKQIKSYFSQLASKRKKKLIEQINDLKKPVSSDEIDEYDEQENIIAYKHIVRCSKRISDKLNSDSQDESD